jgi:electron transfer flavoprotein alpha subunit
MSILAILEQRPNQEGKPEWNRMSFETLAAAQQLAGELGTTASAAVLGQGAGALAGELASKRLDKFYAVEHDLLRDYTPDAYTAALRQLVEHAKPTLALFPHTYQVRDFLPRLATALDRVAVSDVVAHRVENGAPVLVRQLFQGKVNVDVRFATTAPNFASLQAGAYRADQLAEGTAAVETFTPRLDAAQIRTRPLDLFRESQRAVDLSAAEIIVSVGRGIKEAENIPLVEKLAQALGAELAASRPICDAGWLPMERQVGSSGQTVAPKLYLAVGISGAIQHLVGMKGSRTVVAINKDPNAPIFEIADYGIVGDLFQVVPELTAAIQKAKS